MEVKFGIYDKESTKANYAKCLNLESDLMQGGVIYTIYTMMMAKKEIADVFNTKKYQRFLQHLIAHHYLILANNLQFRHDNPNGHFTSAYLTIWASTIFEHSCTPNVLFSNSKNGFVSGIVIRPIKMDEQLYHDGYDSMQISSYSERRNFIFEKSEKQCKCYQCATHIDSYPILTLDPDFQYICNSIEKVSLNHSLVKCDDVKNVQEKCKVFLEKYVRGAWCQELCYVIWHFDGCERGKFSSHIKLYESPNLE